MEAAAHLVPTEKHHGNERGLHEEGQNALNGQRRAENVAHKPGVVAPVGAKLKLENDACGHANGKVNAKELHPKLRGALPKLVFFHVIESFHHGHHNGQPQCEGHKEPVVAGSERKLSSRPVYQGCALNRKEFNHSVSVVFFCSILECVMSESVVRMSAIA